MKISIRNQTLFLILVLLSVPVFMGPTCYTNGQQISYEPVGPTEMYDCEYGANVIVYDAATWKVIDDTVKAYYPKRDTYFNPFPSDTFDVYNNGRIVINIQHERTECSPRYPQGRSFGAKGYAQSEKINIMCYPDPSEYLTYRVGLEYRKIGAEVYVRHWVPVPGMPETPSCEPLPGAIIGNKTTGENGRVVIEKSLAKTDERNYDDIQENLEVTIEAKGYNTETIEIILTSKYMTFEVIMTPIEN